MEWAITIHKEKQYVEIVTSGIADNRGSARVLEKLGMRLEGRFRENEYFKDRWWDTLMYGILESEWKTKQQDRT